MPSAQAPNRVLVVDDDRIIADSLALILRGRGFDTRAVYNCEDAAELATVWNPNAVITDVIMEKMDGVALAIYLGRTLPLSKVLLISGNNDAAELLNAAKNLGHDFPVIAKPYHLDSIFEFLGPLGVDASA